MAGQAAKHQNNMAAYGSRKFYEVPSDYSSKRKNENQSFQNKTVKDLLGYIEEHCIGKDTTFIGPYGARSGKCCLHV